MYFCINSLSFGKILFDSMRLSCGGYHLHVFSNYQFLFGEQQSLLNKNLYGFFSKIQGHTSHSDPSIFFGNFAEVCMGAEE